MKKNNKKKKKKKKKKTHTMRELNLLLQSIPDKDKIGHLFIVDIEFDEVNADEKKVVV